MHFLYPFNIMSNALVVMHNLTCIYLATTYVFICFKFVFLYCFGSLMLFKISDSLVTVKLH